MTVYRWTIWSQIIFATCLAFSWSIGFVVSLDNQLVPVDDLKNGICQRKYIQWSVHDFAKLRGCRVIEGSLQISVLYANSSDAYKNFTFPELREITGYLLLFEAEQLQTLRNIFPNLAVIRGQELLDSHALIIMKMGAMQEVGLSSLTNILKGTVWIVDNPSLCYLDTVDWSIMGNESSVDGIFKNKQQCPNKCHDKCPKSDFGRSPLCWSKGTCQIVHHQTCPNCKGAPCSREGCCHSECLGGCSGPGPDKCDVCKHVRFENRCTDRCPDGYYEYLQRRCVSARQCLNIVSAAPIVSENPKLYLTGKLHTDDDGRKMCVLECPKSTELAPNGTACIRCDGMCKRNCTGRTVDSIEMARELAGCTRITGALKIYIRRGSAAAAGTLVKELKQNLDKIEEIDDYLAIINTYSIYSLDFLENLKVIRGLVLDEEKYALVVKSNENLMELWNSGPVPRPVKIENKKAKVLFHYNPKLCPKKIWDLVKLAGIARPDDDKIDIGITNGDKVPCNTKTLVVEVRQKSNSTVTIRWENFRRNLTHTGLLLNYEVHYKEALNYPKKLESKFEDRDPCGDDEWNVQEQPKISDNHVKGPGTTNEPAWEYDKLIINLKPYSYYALYVKAIVIPDPNQLNKDYTAESDIIYFRTLADIPSKPKNFILASDGPNSIVVSWEPPAYPNGIMSSFKIWIKPMVEDQQLQDQQDYCKDGRPSTVSKSSLMSSFTETVVSLNPTASSVLKEDKEQDCCSCSALGTSSSSSKTNNKKKEDLAYEENSMFDAIMKHVFTYPHIISPPGDNEDPKTNEIRKTRRRRRVIEREQQQSSTSNEVVDPEPVVEFPYNNGNGMAYTPHNGGGDDDYKFPVLSGMLLYKEIPYNSSLIKYTETLENLTHYTTYTVRIQACRDRDSEINENDTRICSETNHERVQTAPLPTADKIDPRTISINVTDGNRLHLRWGEPSSPNGVVMAYTVKVQKVVGKDDTPFIKCITRQMFLKNGKNYTFPEPLHPGNWSVRISVASLAQDSEFTADQYFYVEDLNSVPGFWALVILLPILLTILLTSGMVFYFIRSKGIAVYGRRVISANPEYMPNVDIPDEWEVVPREKIEITNHEFGQGSFGTVYEGILHDFIAGHPKLRCAVKTVAEDTPSEDRALFLKEASLMTKLNCHHVVKLLGVVSKTQPIYVIMELMANGDLKKFLRSRRPDPQCPNADPPPTLRQILRIACEVADGMAYIHSHRLVHRDLAARNCMVSENLSVKVGDFGMTKEVVQTDYYRKQTRGLLPVRWMAPESLRDGVFTNQSDVWSFGVVLWEMATLAAQPYQGLANSQVLDYVASGRIMDRPDNCPDILYDLMYRCWQFDARNRPTFFDILDRLTADLDPSFAQVSFYHSPEGVDDRAQASLRPTQEELITIRTPLRATFDLSDDELDDYDSDEDHQGLSHHIIDDLGDTPARRLLTVTPTDSIPTVKKSLDNGLALTPLTITGNNGLRNGFTNLYPSVSNSNQPSSLFSNPPLRTSYLPTSSSTAASNNNYTTGQYPYSANNSNHTPSADSSIPLTPVKVVNEYNNKKPNSNNTSGDGPLSNSSNNKKSPSTGTTYTTIAPSSQSSGQLISGLINNSNNSSTGLDSNESSKSFSVNFSGDGHNKYNNGGSTGGNGYITLRHSPVSENQSNKTTQF